jgi:hypothetical protein
MKWLSDVDTKNVEIVECIACICSLCGTAFILFSFLRFPNLRTPMSVLVFMLSISDLGELLLCDMWIYRTSTGFYKKSGPLSMKHCVTMSLLTSMQDQQWRDY